MWESSFPGGLAAPLHAHHDAAEFFYVLEGQVSFFVGNGWFEAEPGAFAAIPEGRSTVSRFVPPSLACW